LKTSEVLGKPFNSKEACGQFSGEEEILIEDVFG
jgi:hypothetical protein